MYGTAWRKSTYSEAGNCADVGQEFRKSTYSAFNGSCAEVAPGVLVRDTREAHLGEARTVLAFTPAAWREFTASLQCDQMPGGRRPRPSGRG